MVNFYGTNISWNQFECVLIIPGVKISTVKAEHFLILSCMFKIKILSVPEKAEEVILNLLVVKNDYVI